MTIRHCMNVAVTSHVRVFAPILSPTRPSDVPMRKDSTDVSACWSGFSKWYVRSPYGSNVRAAAMPSWATLPVWKPHQIKHAWCEVGSATTHREAHRARESDEETAVYRDGVALLVVDNRLKVRLYPMRLGGLVGLDVCLLDGILRRRHAGRVGARTQRERE